VERYNSAFVSADSIGKCPSPVLRQRKELNLVDIKDEGGELIFTLNGASGFTPTGNIIRISPDAAKVIDEIRAETGLPASSVASALIAFAGQHYTVKRAN
jgi:hypothetical protein